MNEPYTSTPSSTAVRHDGWTGEKIATFCEVLAETAIVAEACAAAGMSVSGAYAARRRNPLFAAAWDGALTIARDRLADTLLARSMEGNVEQIYRDGILVGERHVLDNALGLAILRRLDRIAETGRSVTNRGEPAQVLQSGERLPRIFDWGSAVEALRTGDDEGVAHALALVAPREVEEVEGPPDSVAQDDADDQGLDLSARCWRDSFDQVWMTDFPPPAGFDGYETRDFDDVANPEPYQRACTPEEAALLDADAAVARSGERAEEEELRDCWFDYLRGEVETAGETAPDPS